MKTRREEIQSLLSLQSMTLHDLARTLRIRTLDAADDLAHIRRSIGSALQITPAACEKCDFTFDKRDRFTAPSRCPNCRSERISGPWISIESAS